MAAYALFATDFRSINDAVEFALLSSEETKKMMHKFIPCLPEDENFKRVKKDDMYTDEKSMSSWNLTLDQSKVCYICNRSIRDHEEGNDIDDVDQEADLLAQLTGADAMNDP